MSPQDRKALLEQIVEIELQESMKTRRPKIKELCRPASRSTLETQKIAPKKINHQTIHIDTPCAQPL